MGWLEDLGFDPTGLTYSGSYGLDPSSYTGLGIDPSYWGLIDPSLFSLSQPTVSGGAPPNINTTSGGAPSTNWLNLLATYGPAILGLGAGALNLGTGIAGLTGGLDPQNTATSGSSTTTATPNVPAQTTQESQLINQIMTGFQARPSGPNPALQQDPLQLLYPAGGQYNATQQYWRNLGSAYDPLQAQIPNIGMQQSNILQSLTPTSMYMAQGGLPITPQLEQTVEQAFTPAAGDVFQRAIESARARGFAGGAELLNQGPAAAIAGPMLADLQGQMAQAKLQYASQLPMQAGQLAAQFNEPLYRRTQAGLGLLQEGGNLGGGLTQAGQAGGNLVSGRSTDLLNNLTQQINLLNTLQQGRLAGKGSTITQNSTGNTANPVDWSTILNSINQGAGQFLNTGASYQAGAQGNQAPQGYMPIYVPNVWSQ